MIAAQDLLKLDHLSLLNEKDKRQARDDVLSYARRTMAGYKVAAFHRKVADALMRVERGECKRLMIIAPPRHGKTQLVAKRFPIWYLGRNPARHVMMCSYGGTLAEDAGREMRNLFESDSHIEIFPELELAMDSKAAGKWHTKQGGVFIAAGVNGPITGRGFHLGVLDDVLKGHEEAESEWMRDKTWNWYLSDFYTRRMQPDAIVWINTRWHDDDPPGRALAEMKARPEADQWEVMHFPALNEAGEALCPEVIPLDMLLTTKATTPARIWQSLYQGDPTPDTGTYFLAETLREYQDSDLTVSTDKTGPRPLEMRTYGASDYAVTSGGGDFTAHLVVGVTENDDIYVLDLWREQATSDKWIEAMLDMMDRWQTIMWGEEKGQIEKSVGPFIMKRQRERKIYGARSQWTSSVDKSARARAIQARMSMGKVYFPRSALWWPELRSELLKFPLGKNDDQVDALSLIGRMLHGLAPGQAPGVPADPKGLVVGIGGETVLPDGVRRATFNDVMRRR